MRLNINVDVNNLRTEQTRRSINRRSGINDNQKREIYELHIKGYGVNEISNKTKLPYHIVYYWVVIKLQDLIDLVNSSNMRIEWEQTAEEVKSMQEYNSRDGIKIPHGTITNFIGNLTMEIPRELSEQVLKNGYCYFDIVINGVTYMNCYIDACKR